MVCADVTDDRFELTLLERREETEPRFALFAVFRVVGGLGCDPLVRRFMLPRPRPVAGLLLGPPKLGDGYDKL